MHFQFSLLLLSLMSWKALTVSQIYLRDSGLVGVSIKLEEGLPFSRSKQILRNIEDAFTSASKLLHTATGLYFREIIILVPEEWPGNFEKRVRWDGMTVDVVVTKNGAEPTTVQSLGCGIEGDVIQLPLDFLLKEASSKERTDLIRAKLLVDEWIKYRYGVFDERGARKKDNAIFPESYWNDFGLQFTTCLGGLRNLDSATYTSSVSGEPIPTSVGYFCNASNHNREAPTPQNIICNYLSIWEVMQKHPDFKNAMSRSPADIDNLTLTFIVTKKTEHQVAIVVDASADAKYMINSFQQVASEFLFDFIPESTWLHVIDHGSGITHVDLPMTKLTADTSRENILDSLPHEADGQPDLPRAVEQASKALESNSNRESTLFIMSSTYTDLITIMKNTRVPNNTHVVIFVCNDGALPDFNETDVHAFITNSHGDIISTMRGAFWKAFNQILLLDHLPGATVTLVEDQFTGQFSSSFYVDESTSDNLILSVTYNIANSVQDIIIAPPERNMIFFTHSGGLCEHDVPRKKIACRIPTAQVGLWRVSVKADSSIQKLNLLVTARCKRNCVTVTSWVADKIDKAGVTSIFAFIHRAGVPLLKVNATGTLASASNPMIEPVKFRLSDDGLDADVMALDGVYTAFFPAVEYSGWYTLTVISAISHQGNRIEPFQRVTQVGSRYMLKNQKRSPRRVVDLKATVEDKENLICKLQWTALGGGSVDLRWSHSRSTLLNNFHGNEVIAKKDVLEGTMEAGPAGSTQTLLVRLESRRTVHFALSIVDKTENVGLTSNIGVISSKQLIFSDGSTAAIDATPTRWGDAIPTQVSTSVSEKFGTPELGTTTSLVEVDFAFLSHYLVAFAVVLALIFLFVAVALVVILHRLSKIEKRWRTGSYDLDDRQQFLMENVMVVNEPNDLADMK